MFTRDILPLSARPDFLPLPANPRDCTPEQCASFWGGDVNGVLLDLAREYRAALAQTRQWGDDSDSEGQVVTLMPRVAGSKRQRR